MPGWIRSRSPSSGQLHISYLAPRYFSDPLGLITSLLFSSFTIKQRPPAPILLFSIYILLMHLPNSII
ncbi:hypothetical protein EYC80_001252 [Monilinia laxa]|uniref:Uncharacterized protein n=1 Tax=Monilinia laxa TaxID=61186 RepID=A0A5N6K8N4_MONLA|nr:hypothetical protein EYC80_001252 [Monilinia laxa]